MSKPARTIKKMPRPDVYGAARQISQLRTSVWGLFGCLDNDTESLLYKELVEIDKRVEKLSDLINPPTLKK